MLQRIESWAALITTGGNIIHYNCSNTNGDDNLYDDNDGNDNDLVLA